jgi:putative SOS response-associated peptidase YedK
LFTKKGDPRFCVAGIWRANKEVGEAFTLLTMESGPNIAPYHDCQLAILDRAAWLDPSVPAQSALKPLSAGSLLAEQVA